MNALKNSLILILFAVLVFSSCKNDLKLDAPYKETPTIYALMNPNEAVQMIRINKVFLGEGNANQMAQVSDSINYQPGELTVTLTRFINDVQVDAGKNKGLKRTIEFSDSMVTTEKGAFNTNQRVYVSYDTLFNSGDYVLTVTNNHTGNVFTAKATAIDQVNGNQGYGALTPPYFPYPPGYNVGFINYSSTSPSNVVGSILFQPVTGGKVYQVIVRTHYYNDLNGSYTYDYVDYIFDDPRTLRVLSGTSFINVTFKSGDYFSNMGLVLSKKNLGDVTGRKVYLMEFIINASTQEYSDFLEFSKPSLSLNQNKPLYSNFTDKAALGLFTFRSTVSVLKEPDAVFVNAFSSDANTCRYKFYDNSNVVQGCR